MLPSTSRVTIPGRSRRQPSATAAMLCPRAPLRELVSVIRSVASGAFRPDESRSGRRLCIRWQSSRLWEWHPAGRALQKQPAARLAVLHAFGIARHVLTCTGMFGKTVKIWQAKIKLHTKHDYVFSFKACQCCFSIFGNATPRKAGAHCLRNKDLSSALDVNQVFQVLPILSCCHLKK